jgi:hypothetical protein
MLFELETVFTSIRRYFFMGDLENVADLLQIHEYHNTNNKVSPDVKMQPESRLSNERASNDSNISDKPGAGDKRSKSNSENRVLKQKMAQKVLGGPVRRM